MATADDYAAWIVRNSAKRGTPEFDTVAQAYQLAKAEENTAQFQQQNAPLPQQPGIGEQILGAGETALALATGATGGAIGMVGGAGLGLAQQILSGKFGTPEAVRAVEQAAMRGAEALTFQPRTQAGQQQTQAIGEFLGEALPPVLPIIAAPGSVMQATRTAAPTAGAIGQLAAGQGQRLAQATGQAVAKPVQAATTAVRETFGMETPAAQAAATARASGGAAATPEALQRVTTAEGLPVPVSLTRGAATRDPLQLAFEKAEMKSELGGPLRDRAELNNLQLIQNFDALIEMTDAQLGDLSSTGGAVVRTLTSGLAAAKNKTRAAYKAAENAGELETNVNLNNVIDYINQNIPEGDLAPVLKAAQNKAIAIGAAVPGPDGKLIPQPITLAQAESLRKTFQRAGFDGADQYHGGELRKVFDAETEGMGGDLYKKARQIRTEQARKFENRAIVARLIKNRKGMDDPQVAADQVFQKSILNASPEEITFLRRVLSTTGEDGKQAFKELQAATLRHLQEASTKGLGMDTQGRPIISPAKLNQAVKALDSNGRLDVILGKTTAQTVRDLNDVIQYVNTVPPGTLINTSGTTGTLLAALGEAGALGATTGLPLPIISGIKQISKMRKEGKTKAKINDALNALPPVNK
jgi:hypothetical protein